MIVAIRRLTMNVSNANRSSSSGADWDSASRYAEARSRNRASAPPTAEQWRAWSQQLSAAYQSKPFNSLGQSAKVTGASARPALRQPFVNRKRVTPAAVVQHRVAPEGHMRQTGHQPPLDGLRARREIDLRDRADRYDNVRRSLIAPAVL